MLYLISPLNEHEVSALAPPHPRPASDDITEPEFVRSRQSQLPVEGDYVQHHRFISDIESSQHLTSSDHYSVDMAEESRGKRRKQANPRRNQVDIERLSSLSSEGEDDLLLWGMEAQDAAELQDKTSLTPSEGTEAGSPARLTRAHSLSPEPSPWASTNTAPAVPAVTRDGGALNAARRDGDRPAAGVYSRAEEEELAHYDFLAQLRKASHAGGLLDGQKHNGSSGTYLHEDTPPACWSPGEYESPEGPDGVPVSPDGLRGVLACPFCQRSYRREPALREHIKFCHERDEGLSTCPICGFSAPYRAQMERHMLLHTQPQERGRQPLSEPAMENRKFKCMQCGKAFKYKHHLKEHLRIHSGEKPYECSNCKKRFSHSGSYSSHLSSKKCLNGGAAGGGAGVVGGGGGGMGPFNGHSHPAYLNSSSTPTSPPAAGGRNSSLGKGSPLPPEHHSILPQEQGRAQDLSRLWDPTAELSLRASVFKGTTLLPYLHSGSKFEHLLQEMLRREVQRQDGVPPREEERPAARAKAEARGSPEGVRHGEVQPSGAGGVTCRWCAQLFPSAAVLLQHERYLCKMNRSDIGATAADVLDNPRPKEGSPLNFSRGPQEPPKTPTAALSNGLSKERSPLQRSPWQAVPQQLLVALHSPLQLRSEPAHPSRPYWPNPEVGSPGGKPPISPAAGSGGNADTPSTPLQDRRRLLSPGFASPLGMDLSSSAAASIGTTVGSPAGRPTPPRRTPGSAGSQCEPLDLSLPKHQAPENQRERGCNGMPRADKRDLDGPYRTPPPRYGGAPTLQPGAPAPFVGGAPMFGGSVYGAYPLFNPMIPAGLRGAAHESMPSLPVNRATPNSGFLSPLAYMLDSDTESVLKRIHQERQALMSEALSRGCLDYLSVMEEGLDGDGGPGRKRLRKTEEGLYACDICDKTFQKSSSLLRHKYEHTGKRPHECKICKKAFKHKHHLIEHSRLHSGEKPYQCDKCGKRFSHSGSYSQHMNHRYAYCSRDHDQDPDGDGPAEEPSAGEEARYPRPFGLELPTEDNFTNTTNNNNNNNKNNNNNTSSMEENSNFFSDSSLDGGFRGEEDEEEEEEEEVEEEEQDRGNNHRGDAGAGEDLRGSPSPGLEHGTLRSEGEQEREGSRRLSNGELGEQAETDGGEDDHCEPREEDTAMELSGQVQNSRSTDTGHEEHV